jgi:hypothetical protein
MNPTARSLRTGVFGLTLLLVVTTVAFAQGGATSSISGTVTDASGAVIPGADIVAKNNATSAESRAVSSASGTFTIPALNAGTYTLTVTLIGFKTVILKDVVVNAGIPASVRATMEIGGLEENVVVQAASDIVQTQSATVATTLSVNQISKLPLTSRNALDFVVNLPGTNTPSTARNSTAAASCISGSEERGRTGVVKDTSEPSRKSRKSGRWTMASMKSSSRRRTASTRCAARSRS